MIEPLEGARASISARIFYKPDAPKEATHWTERQKHPIDDVLDRKLIELARPALEAQAAGDDRAADPQRRPLGRRDAVGRGRQALQAQGPAATTRSR